ncbi:MAG: HAD family phosphatase, partial [Clostridia bacterium]|nr:HAD family phosphatase [Clostridia bacterium]
LASVPRPWYKVIFVQDPELTPGVMQSCLDNWGSRYEFDRSWPMGIELHQKGSDKGACLDFIRKWMNDPELKIVGVGDYENDISLIRESDIGYAVGNADQAVKDVADRVTVRNTENAIAAIIRDLRAME